MMKSFIIRRRVLLAHFKAERHVIMASLECNNARSFREQQQLQSTDSHSHHSLCVCVQPSVTPNAAATQQVKGRHDVTARMRATRLTLRHIKMMMKCYGVIE